MSSPTPSFSDSSDASTSEHDYHTIRPRRLTGTGTTTTASLLHSRRNVYLHPTAAQADNISGYIALLRRALDPDDGDNETSASPTSPTDAKPRSKDADALLLAWVPESSGLGKAREVYERAVTHDVDEDEEYARPVGRVPLPPVMRDGWISRGMTTGFAVPLKRIARVVARPPNRGWWFGSVEVQLRGAGTVPTAFFHNTEPASDAASSPDWGGDDVLRWLRQYVAVERSTVDPSIYLVDPSDAERRGVARPTATQVRNLLQGDNSSAPPLSPPDISEALSQARWSLLEKFAQVTTWTRRSAAAVAEHRNLPPPVRRLMANPQVQTMGDEFDSARLYLARWAMSIAEQAERDAAARRRRGHDRSASWSAAREREHASELGAFALVDAAAAGEEEADTPEPDRRPVTRAEWDSWFDAAGRLRRSEQEVRQRIFFAGLDADDGVRPIAWLFLLGVFDWRSSRAERRTRMQALREEYETLQRKWWERMVAGEGLEEEREAWMEERHRIEKDVHRTDRHIPLFAGEDMPHPDPTSPFATTGTNVHLEQLKDLLLTYHEHEGRVLLGGYVQGMSDLLAPLYAVLQPAADGSSPADDADASGPAAVFWAFVAVMRLAARNFRRDQAGMRTQLAQLEQLTALLDPALHAHLARCDATNFFFAFRMLLVWFKREVDFAAVPRLWERALFARPAPSEEPRPHYPPSAAPVLLAAALLDTHRHVLRAHCAAFDQLLRYVHDLAGRIDVDAVLARAETLAARLRRVIAAADERKAAHALPAPPVVSPPSSPSSSEPPATAPSVPELVVSPELRMLLRGE